MNCNMIIAGIVAGGNGSRMGTGNMPKQFFDLCGKPVIVHTIGKFLSCSDIDNVIVGINPAWKDYMQELKCRYFPKAENLFITDGGNDRNKTILNIISCAKSIGADDNDIIVTHDAVRPFVTEKMISDNIKALEKYDVCTTAISAVDTIVCSDNGNTVTDFPVRSNMFQEQTPQTFRTGAFEMAYNSITESEHQNITDACKLFYLCGYDVGIVRGDVSNIKITYPFDYRAAKMLIKNPEY